MEGVRQRTTDSMAEAPVAFRLTTGTISISTPGATP
jgi:hypothetical protein